MKKLAIYSILFLFAVLGSLSVFAQEGEPEERLDVFYKDIHAPKKKPVPLPSVRKADVVWEKLIWRSIDLKQRFNQYFYYPVDAEKDAQGRISLINAVWNAVKSGKITVYEDDEFKTVKDFSRLENQYNKLDTVWQDEWDEDDNYIGQKMVVSQQHFSDVAKDFYRIDLKEWWFIDKEYTREEVRIVGLSFVRDMYRVDEATQERNYLGPQRFGWIRMQDPAVRELLAQTQAYNEYNDAAWLNYDQVFLKRYFDSMITRESNVKNRTIDQYKTGVDVLIEAERIKEDILNKELDLWEY